MEPAAVLDDAAFARLMAAFAPFEPAPRLALAVSGGADSMALALLAGRWARGAGGEAVVALVVDHALREGSAAEAAETVRRCRSMGLAAELLVWEGPKPATAVEEAARTARYRLLDAACRRRGLLHLLTAHHADDQAETIALRRASGSGPHGLAGMSACVERPGWRLLRPFLAVPKARLVATLERRGLAWFEDPMNADQRYARARLRRRGMPRVRETRDAAARLAFEAALAEVLPRVATLDRFGVGRLDRARWLRLGDTLRRGVVMRLALAVGGREHPPAAARLDRFVARLACESSCGATLGHCQWRAEGDAVLVCREARNLPPPLALEPGEPVLWDGRFRVSTEMKGLTVLPLGHVGLRQRDGGLAGQGPMAAARRTLPGFQGLEGLVAVPHLDPVRGASAASCKAILAPRHALSPVPFAVPAE